MLFENWQLVGFVLALMGVVSVWALVELGRRVWYRGKPPIIPPPSKATKRVWDLDN